MSLQFAPYISAEKIQTKVSEMGKALTDKFSGKPVVAVCILKGSFIFYSDLIRNIDLDIKCEFFGVSSYSGASSSGEVQVTLDLTTPVENQNVLLIEDIVDTGITMNYLIQNIQGRKPKSLTTISLLEKPQALKVPCKIDMVGFKIPNDFVVGYGLDYNGLYRNLPYIAQVSQFN
jgi:hypoxanthine phosphoribosyltransferase